MVLASAITISRLVLSFLLSDTTVVGAVVVATTVVVGEVFWTSTGFSISTIFLGLPSNTDANLLKYVLSSIYSSSLP